ncbi:hypothetical protein LR48_Vigan311s000700 [Vigna angularis]|uniref:Uncharacterized protein n=1 Tax=Phaseolus angularis TaxID=3914 RepID=A0A0L9T835_PHAAN|nr:hypothetical protein LR48_Vigan311s000700 [Vigna angularis]
MASNSAQRKRVKTIGLKNKKRPSELDGWISGGEVQSKFLDCWKKHSLPNSIRCCHVSKSSTNISNRPDDATSVILALISGPIRFCHITTHDTSALTHEHHLPPTETLVAVPLPPLPQPPRRPFPLVAADIGQTATINRAAAPLRHRTATTKARLSSTIRNLVAPLRHHLPRTAPPSTSTATIAPPCRASPPLTQALHRIIRNLRSSSPFSEPNRDSAMDAASPVTTPPPSSSLQSSS